MRIEKETPSPTRIETTRLTGTPLAEADFGDLRLLHSDPRVAATLAVDGKPIAESVTRDMIVRSIEHWRVHGFGLFSFRLCASGALLVTQESSIRQSKALI